MGKDPSQTGGLESEPRWRFLVIRRSLVPRYFFDIHSHVDLRDDQGLELLDLGAARTQAAIALAEAALDASPSAGKDLVVIVRDEEGVQVVRGTLSVTTDPEV